MAASHRTSLHRFYRTAPRRWLGRPSTLRGQDGTPTDVQIDDLSTKGCRLTTAPGLALHDHIHIGLPGIGSRAAQIMWLGDGVAGCQFAVPLTAQDVERVQETRSIVARIFNIAPPVDGAAPTRATRIRRVAYPFLVVLLVASIIAIGLLLIRA